MLKPKTLHASTFHFYLERVSENWEQSCLPEAWTGSLGTSRALPSGALLAWGPLCRPRVGCGKGPGLWVQILVLPQPWSANDLQNEEKSPSTRGDPRCRRAGESRGCTGGPPSRRTLTWSTRGAWTRVPGPGVLTGRSACGPPCSCAWSRGRMGYRRLPDGNSAMPPS